MSTNQEIEAAFNCVSQRDDQGAVHRSKFGSEPVLDERYEDAGVQRTGPVAGVVPPTDEHGVPNG